MNNKNETKIDWSKLLEKGKHIYLPTYGIPEGYKWTNTEGLIKCEEKSDTILK